MSQVAIGFDISEEEVRPHFEKALPRFTDFFNGKGPSHVLVYYQPRDKKTEVRAGDCGRRVQGG